MKTVKLEEIVRQKDPELKQTVEQLARGQVAEAIAGLERQGRIHEFKGHGERIAAIASEYAKSPDGTLVVSPDNRSRAEINQAIHSELQAKGVVSSDEHRVHILVPPSGPHRSGSHMGRTLQRRGCAALQAAARKKPASEKVNTRA